MNNYINNIYNIKIYKFDHSWFFSTSLSIPYWIKENNQNIFLNNKSGIVFFKKNYSWIFFKTFFIKFFENFSFFSSLLKFKWFRFVLFSGLGYKRKFFTKYKIIFIYVADRHWILYKFNNFSSVIPTKKRNFIFISPSKGSMAKDYSFFSSSSRPYMYKTKGFLDRRVKRRFLFVRRSRLRKVKVKLSKKQRLL